MSSAAAAPATAARSLSFMEKIDLLVSFYRLWTDAKDAHIAKYMAKYQALYPAAQILLLRSAMSYIVRPSQIGPAMRVATSVVRAAFQTPVSFSSPSLLIHIFSNGGSSSIANLYARFAATAGPNDDKCIPPHATIFDSCPGLFRIPCAVAFVSFGLPSFQQMIAAPFLHAFAAFWTV